MAGKLTDMSKIKQLLLLKKQGKSNREAAKLLVLCKETVNRYLKFINESNLNTEELLLLDDPVLEPKFNPGNAAYLDSRFEDFQRELDSIIKELEEAHKTHVTRELLWKDYIEKYPDGYALMSMFMVLCREKALLPSLSPLRLPTRFGSWTLL